MNTRGISSTPALKIGHVLVLLLCLLFSSCAPKATVQPAQATLPPTTAPTDTQAPTNTPKPTDTPVPTSTTTNTPLPTATATPDLKATAVAKKAAQEAAALEKIKPDLEKYGYSPNQGHLVWMSSESYTLKSTSFLELRYYQLDEVEEVSNFIIQSNVNWETSSGLAGCAILFRAEKDMEQGKQNMFFFMRLQNAPAWDISFREFGTFQNSLTGDFVFTNNLKDKNKTDNKVALVAKGQDITPYLNVHKERTLQDTKLADTAGGFALASYQESGKTTCTFNDTWVWAIDK